MRLFLKPHSLFPLLPMRVKTVFTPQRGSEDYTGRAHLIHAWHIASVQRWTFLWLPLLTPFPLRKYPSCYGLARRALREKHRLTAALANFDDPNPELSAWQRGGEHCSAEGHTTLPLRAHWLRESGQVTPPLCASISCPENGSNSSPSQSDWEDEMDSN